MGIQDRDWYRDAVREREKQAQLNETKSKFTQYTEATFGTRAARKPTSSRSYSPWQLLPILVFWMVVMGVLYALMNHYLKPHQPKVSANGQLVIKKSHDGHFYTPGTVNGHPVIFMVDTGATLVSVSESVAQKSSIRGGVQTVFKTANGNRPGRVVDGVHVAIGPYSIDGIKVGVGLGMTDENDALLGQSFLSKFSVSMSGNTMTLKPIQ